MRTRASSPNRWTGARRAAGGGLLAAGPGSAHRYAPVAVDGARPTSVEVSMEAR